MKKKTVKIPLYYGEVTIIKAKKMSEVAEKYKLKCGRFEAVVWRDEKKDYLKLFVAFGKKIEADVIAHETVHLVNHVFIHTGIKIDEYNDEAQAYLTGWFVKTITKFLKK